VSPRLEADEPIFDAEEALFATLLAPVPTDVTVVAAVAVTVDPLRTCATVGVVDLCVAGTTAEARRAVAPEDDDPDAAPPLPAVVVADALRTVADGVVVRLALPAPTLRVAVAGAGFCWTAVGLVAGAGRLTAVTLFALFGGCADAAITEAAGLTADAPEGCGRNAEALTDRFNAGGAGATVLLTVFFT
jgi:hypothetical protein